MAGRHATKAPRRRPRLLIPALVAAAALLVGGVVVANAASGGCSGSLPVRVAAAPEIAPVLREATAALQNRGAQVGGTCVDFQVSAAAPDQVASALEAQPDKAPELWVPDFSVWVTRTALAGATPAVLSTSLAKTPVVTAGPHATQPASWMEVGKTTVAYLDPLRSSASTAALLSAFGEMAVTGATKEQMGGMMVPLAQRYGAQPDKPTTIQQVATNAAKGAYGVMTEQQLVSLQQHGQAKDLVAQVPKSGTMVLDYPLAALTPDQRARDAGSQLAAYMAGADGAKLLAKHGFRNTADEPLASGAGLGKRGFSVLKMPDAGAVNDALRQWGVLTVPARSIAVIDVSGSMDYTDQGQSRIGLAVGAAKQALQLYPDNAQIGLWAFSTELDGNRDYRPLADIRPLGQAEGSGTHRDGLNAALDKLPGMTNGGTGLYETTLAAVRTLQAGYDPKAENTVILLTDGRNDDPDTMTLQQLTDTLQRERDPARPVSVIAVGMGPQADAHALAQIAGATGGRSYIARNPQDITHVFVDAMLSR